MDKKIYKDFDEYADQADFDYFSKRCAENAWDARQPEIDELKKELEWYKANANVNHNWDERPGHIEDI